MKAEPKRNSFQPKFTPMPRTTAADFLGLPITFLVFHHLDII